MSRKPNLLFIFSDQHRADVAGCYGDVVAETPNIDRLAGEGIAFDNAYCPAPICTPSRMSMMTARHPHRNRVWGNEDILHSGIPTMAHSLGAAGLNPTLVGRLHSVGPDQLLGYAHREVGDHHANWLGAPRVDMGPLQGTASPDRRSLSQSGPGLSAYEVKDEDVTEAAVARLERYAEEMKSGKLDRFAMTVGLMLPHAPFVAQRADFERFKEKVGLDEVRAPDPADDHPWLAAWRAHREIASVEEAEERRARAAYYGLVFAMDRMIGRILDRLDALGLAEDTLVIYASDHGEHIGDHGLWWKHTFYDASAKVPVVMRWPGELPAGERRRQVVNLVDLTATILDAMQAPELPNADGVSFLDVARNGDAPWVDRTFSEYCYGSSFDWGIPGAGQNRMIRSGRYKLNYYHGHRPQLFDLEADPGEQNDLATDPAFATIREQLVAEVTADWDPLAVERDIETRIAEKRLLRDWAAKVEPESTYLWPMKPEHNRLETAK